MAGRGGAPLCLAWLLKLTVSVRVALPNLAKYLSSQVWVALVRHLLADGRVGDAVPSDVALSLLLRTAGLGVGAVLGAQKLRFVQVTLATGVH